MNCTGVVLTGYVTWAIIIGHIENPHSTMMRLWVVDGRVIVYKVVAGDAGVRFPALFKAVAGWSDIEEQSEEAD